MLFFKPLNLAVSETASEKFSPLVVALLDMSVPPPVASLVYLIVALCGRLTFLLPGLVYALLASRSLIDRNLRIMFGGVALAGIALLTLIEAVVSQEIWAFYWYADLGLALLGAAGLGAIWINRASIPNTAVVALSLSAALFFVQARDFVSGFAPKLHATSFPTPRPTFRSNEHAADIEETLKRTIGAGDVLVTGGQVGGFDDRVLPAAVPGLQLYASRLILPIYAARVTVDPAVASRLWILEDDLARSDARDRIRADIRPERSLYLLWIGEQPPVDRAGLVLVKNWTGKSLWRVERTAK